MYSVAIVIVMALLMAAVIILEFYSLEKKSVYDKGIFLIFSLVATGFAVGRPTGIVSDDYGYEPKFNALCPVMECGQWIQSSRDFAWYTLVAFLKSFFDTPRVMLWMSGFFLTIKLAVIYLLTSRKALALLIYMAVFYIIQDVIAFRVSSAAAIYLLGFYLASRKCFISTSLASFISGAFHAQAILAPLSLIGLWSKPRAQWVNAMIWVPMILLMFGLYPSIDWVKPLINEHSVIRSVSQGLSEMLVFFAKGDREQVRPMPLVVPPLLFLVIYIYNRGIPDKNYMLRYAYFSTGIASLFLWLLAHNASPQPKGFSLLPGATAYFNWKCQFLPGGILWSNWRQCDICYEVQCASSTTF